MIARLVLSIAVLLLTSSAARLPAPTGDEYRIARALGTPALRKQFQTIRTAWFRETGACGRDAACRVRIDKRRADVLAALAARVSDENPALLDLDAWVMTGTWIAGPVTSLDGVYRPYPVENGVPEANAAIAARPGQWCSPECSLVGLEPTAIDGADRGYAARLSLSPGSPALLAMVNGRAQFRVVAAGGKIALLITACTSGMRNCAPAFVMLAPQDEALLAKMT